MGTRALADTYRYRIRITGLARDRFPCDSLGIALAISPPAQSLPERRERLQLSTRLATSLVADTRPSVVLPSEENWVEVRREQAGGSETAARVEVAAR